MTSTQKLVLRERQQLIDLNGDTTNFNLTFDVSSKGAQPFEAVVVDQTILDNEPSVEFRPSEHGNFSGNLISDKNIYQNYFLCLRSKNECEVTVTITKQEIPANIPPPPSQEIPTMAPPEKSGGKNWLLLFVVLAILIGGAYYFFNSRSDSLVENNNRIPPQVFNEASSSSEASSGGFYSRLNKLNLDY